MKRTSKFLLLVLLLIALLAFGWLRQAHSAQIARAQNTGVAAEEIAIAPPEPELTHAQGVWLGALEWCESRGVPTAVNAVDRDGTASYYSFQFKPYTFRWLSWETGIVSQETALGWTNAEVMERMAPQDAQYRIMARLVVDDYTYAWWVGQFPDCIRKLGAPPRY